MLDEDGTEKEQATFIALTDKEVERCLAVVDNLENRAIFMLMLDTGLSLNEILGDDKLDTPCIHIQDVHARELTVTVCTRFVKDDPLTTREVPISVDTLIAIKNYLFDIDRTFEIRGELFTVKERRVRQFLVELSEKAGLEKKITPIMCRRTAIVKMLKAGLKPNEVRRRMGFIKPKEDIILSAAGYFVMQPEAYERMVRNALIETFVAETPLAPTLSGHSGFSGARR